jgi:O-succinylbenzoic acid--CoA ligase
VAVGAADDPEWGQRVVAWVVPRDRNELPTLETVRRCVTDSLPAFMAPKELRVIDHLPTTTSGKVVRRALGT